MKKLLLLSSLFSLLGASVFSQTKAVTKTIATSSLTESLATGAFTLTVASGGTLTVASGGAITVASGSTLTYTAGAALGGSLSEFRDDLGVEIGADVQAFDSDLTSIAALTTTAFGRGLLDDADAAAVRASIGLTTGSVDNAVLAADGTGGVTLQARDITMEDAATATANSVGLSNAHSGQTNSSFRITPKGTGSFHLGPVMDGAGTGGNARGQYAVDLQISRGATASRVASGNYSAIIGGQGNTASGSYSSAWGLISIASGSISTAFGDGSTASGQGAMSWGYLTTASGDYATAHGARAVAATEGEMAHAAGRFTVDGDAQSSRHVMRCETTDATANVEMFTGVAGSTRIVIAEDETWSFWALVVARRTDTDNSSACYIVQGCLDRNTAGNATLVGAVTTTTVGEDVAAWNATASADATNQSLKFAVTGAAGSSIHWVATVIISKTKG